VPTARRKLVVAACAEVTSISKFVNKLRTLSEYLLGAISLGIVVSATASMGSVACRTAEWRRNPGVKQWLEDLAGSHIVHVGSGEDYISVWVAKDHMQHFQHPDSLTQTASSAS